jgi:hypothetical protein
MFNSFAGFDACRRHVPEAALPHSNDNRPGTRLRAPAAPQIQLFCRWQPNARTGRLECHWQRASGGEIAAGTLEPSPAPPARIAVTPARSPRVA